VTLCELTNQDIFAYALYRLQGAGRFVDVEDVYVECWRLSPSRFGWRKHQYPNYKVSSKAQRDFEKAHPELLLKTPNGLARQLTAEGVAWIRNRLPDFASLASGTTKAPAPRRPSHKIITELTTNPLVRAFLEGKPVELTKVQVADLLHCAPDSPRSIWKQRAATLRSAATDNERPDVMQFVEYIQRSHPEWFEEGDKT
jgi:hypothetical protein